MIDRLKNLPDAPGVYQYYDHQDRLLYVGKAKSLKKRVKSYFRFTPGLSPAPNLSPRIYKMISEAKRLETIVTPTENDALLLENSLIKQLKPKYNILLRDDKTYPYIYIDLSDPFPRFELTRKVVKGKKVRYFGPFPHGAKAILDSLYELVPLVQKKGCVQGKRACLYHQIDRCMAPCEGKISSQEYAKLVEEAFGYIHHKKKLLHALESKMNDYAQSLRFEEAAKIRDRIDAIEKAQTYATADLARLEDLDIFALSFDDKEGVLVRLFIREGKVVSSSHIYLTSVADERERNALYRRSILEFYSAETPFTAKSILTAHPLPDQKELTSILHDRFGKKIEITTPRRGDKKRLVDLALQNGAELLRQHRTKSKNNIQEHIMALLELETPPRRIEVFDNSHLMGEACVGAMVVYTEEGWEKKSYRHYNLQSRDEYAQMQEMLEHRITSFHKAPPPDLWVIDGGETLRTLAETLLKKAGLYLPVVAIAKEKLDAKAHRAKGAAKDILYSSSGTLRLPPSDRRLQWFQKLRDEAHRFVLAYHKKKRLEKQKRISLLEIHGIGPGKIKKLLDYFGSFEAIRQADEAAIATILNKTDARSIIKYLKENHA